MTSEKLSQEFTEADLCARLAPKDLLHKQLTVTAYWVTVCYVIFVRPTKFGFSIWILLACCLYDSQQPAPRRAMRPLTKLLALKLCLFCENSSYVYPFCLNDAEQTSAQVYAYNFISDIFLQSTAGANAGAAHEYSRLTCKSYGFNRKNHCQLIGICKSKVQRYSQLHNIQINHYPVLLIRFQIKRPVIIKYLNISI